MLFCQRELRQELLSRRQARVHVDSLHNTALTIPSTLFEIDQATLKSKIDAVMTSAVPEVHDKPWYSNNATTTKRLRDNADLCSHLLGSIMILDPAWVSIAESHNAEVLDGAEETLMTPVIMSTYFLDCAKVRDIAFDLVCTI